jgi:hypothetical protein
MPVRDRQNDHSTTVSKRRKTSGSHRYLAPSHPHGVKPSGNGLFARSSVRHTSLGRLSALSDELILHIYSLLDPSDWATLQRVSHVCRVFALHETHWKEALTDKTGGHLKCWSGSWQNTYLSHYVSNQKSRPRSAPIRVQGLFSDALFMPLQLASSPLDSYIPHDTASKRVARSLERVNASTLNRDSFMEEYASKGRPCLLLEDASTNTLPQWKLNDLKEILSSRRIRSEALTMTMACYCEYAKSCQEAESWIPDESPYYLFDPTLARSMQKQGTFVVPSLFRKNDDSDQSSMRKDWDLFSLLQESRPDNAWVIAGPGRSGSGVSETMGVSAFQVY